MFKDKEEKLILKLPPGFRDFFPLEAQERNAVEDIIREVFISWGYGEVKTPVIEYTKNISAGVGKDWKDKLISFFDNDGDLVSFRADMTIPIARLTAMRIKSRQLPVRFFYFANSFRQTGLQKGQKRVLNQAGLELIGMGGLRADTEILILLAEILNKLHIRDFKIGIGHIGLINGLCNWFGLKDEDEKKIKKDLIFNDIVSIDDFLRSRDKNKTPVFMDILCPVNDIKLLEKKIKKIGHRDVTEAYDYINNIYGFLQKSSLSDHIIIDPGIIREFGYYSGLIFEVYCPEIVEKLGSGGRYDGLVKKFGFDAPATGFALDVDLLHKAIGRDGLSMFRKKNSIIVYNDSADFSEVLKYAEKLRKDGNRIELLSEADAKIEELLENRKADYLYKIGFEKNKAIRLEVHTGEAVKLEL